MERFLDWFDRQSQKKLDVPCTILGEHATTAEEANRQLVQLALWTYRSGFKDPLPNSRLTTDKNWGCLIRTSQMLLSRVLQLHGAFDASDFRDSPDARFSIHSLVRAVADPHNDFKPEFWAPSQGCEALRAVVAKAQVGFTVLVVECGCIYNDEVVFALSRMPVLLLLPCRPTASERITQCVFQTMEHLLASKHCVGIVGGVPRRSYYFVGTTAESQRLIFLDPHVRTQEAFLDMGTLSYACEGVESVGCVDWPRIDSSLMVGVYLQSARDLQEFTAHLSTLWRYDSDAFISIAPSRSSCKPRCSTEKNLIDEVETF
jgi:cysteine protease ATG4